MTDPRIQKLAQVLVHYSLNLGEGQELFINSTPLAEPLVAAVYHEALLAGALPSYRLAVEQTQETLLKHGSETQIQYVPGWMRQIIEETDARLVISAPENTKALSNADPEKVTLHRQATHVLTQRTIERAALGELQWTLTEFPTQAAAQDAEMSLQEYEDFVYGAGKLDDEDPVAAWQRVHKQQQRIIDFLSAKQEIRLVGPGTDLTYHVGGRTWINADGHRNFPDGEVFTGPHETKTEGYIRFTYPAVYAGREVADIRLEFKEGKVVKASAGKGESLLLSLLDMDEGARRVGEVAFGLNYDINVFTRNILFDEKIGGTVHLALGAAYPDTGGQNKSGIHWDMICDMRQDSKVFADGELVYVDGKFII